MTARIGPPQHLNLVTHDIIGSAIEVHRCLGPGLLESVYLECLCHEVRMRNVTFDREIALPLRYKRLALEQVYRLDLVVAVGPVDQLQGRRATLRHCADRQLGLLGASVPLWFAVIPDRSPWFTNRETSSATGARLVPAALPLAQSRGGASTTASSGGQLTAASTMR